MFSYFFIEKFLWESGFSNFGQNQNDTLKNRLFCRHFETVQHFKNLFPELWFLIAHTYMVQISLQNSDGKVVFLGGIPWRVLWTPPPLGHQRQRE